MPRPLTFSAQRLSASKERIPFRPRQLLAPRRVLNAFRHQRRGYPPTRRALELAAKCSTPFGIKGEDTGCARWSRRQTSSAQRLSASKERIHAPRYRDHHNGLSAQRLSASKERIRHRQGDLPFDPQGAQRLSASKERIHLRLGRTSGIKRVLNAFRHQRRGYWRHGHSGGDRTCVLNAFRHQRRGYATFQIPSQKTTGAQRLSASKERIHERGRRSGNRQPVLNAFRHQRRGYSLVAATFNIAMVCSTPFGIKGEDTRKGRADLHHCLVVLNAFRHQRRGY